MESWRRSASVITVSNDRPRCAASACEMALGDTPFGEIRIGPDGKGEGKVVPMARIEYDEQSRSIQIENYATEPVRLTQVIEEKRNGK